MIGDPENGLRAFLVGSMGELTEVASAKRAVLGVLRERLLDEELEVEVLGRTLTCAPIFFSSTTAPWEA